VPAAASGKVPGVALILVDGAPSALSSGSWYIQPSTATDHPSVPSFCAEGAQFPEVLATPFPAGALSDALGKWNFSPPPGYFDAQDVFVNDNHYLTDPFAAGGGVIFPFSYQGATAASTANGPLFSVTAYTQSQSASQPLMQDAKFLDKEISSIHKLPGWGQVPIVVIGHSLGGLVAYTWWQNYGVPFGIPQQTGVTNVFSLDSPINGVATAYQCIGGRIQLSLCLLAQVVGGVQYSNSVFTTLESNWNNLIANDAYYAGVDASVTAPRFSPVGTTGDPLYDGFPHTDGGTPGLVSQVFMTGCSKSFLPLPPFGYSCAGATSPPSIVSTCPVDQAITDKGFGHILVKNCPGVVNDIRIQVFGS
jgi:hypothetical protein